MRCVQRNAPSGIVFFSGYHGVGKTFTANALLNDFNARVVDCGPIIRSLFAESTLDSFSDWAKAMEKKLGCRWDDKLLLKVIESGIENEELLFIVGNRDIETILYLAEKLPHRMPAIILYLEKPIKIIKNGYELRTKTLLSDEEFEKILHSGPDAKLKSVKQYVLKHPDICKLIRENEYSDATIVASRNFIREVFQ